MEAPGFATEALSRSLSPAIPLPKQGPDIMDTLLRPLNPFPVTD
jgi:hypothetical protein